MGSRHSSWPGRVSRTGALACVVGLALTGCGPGGPVATLGPTQGLVGSSPVATAGTATTVPATTAPATVLQARDLVTEVEAGEFFGEPVQRAGPGGFTLGGLDVQGGWDFTTTSGRFLTVGLVEDGIAAFEAARTSLAGQPISGLGDDAYLLSSGPVVLAARMGSTVVYLYTGAGEGDQIDALSALMAVALSRL